MKGAVERFYDDFSRQFVRDYVLGNRRVERQLAFLAAAIPADAARVLVIGCGSGESARYIAAKIARRSEVIAVDISGESLRLARALHPHPRVTYRQLDVLTGTIEGTFDVVILPDVYEHIPAGERGVLHGKLARLLTANGRVLVTIPSPGKQAALAASGEGLQIVDEVVTTADLVRFAHEVQGDLSYVNLISVWETNDYVHAAITRGSDRVAPLAASTSLQVQGVARTRRVTRLMRAAVRYVRLRLRMPNMQRPGAEGGDATG